MKTSDNTPDKTVNLHDIERSLRWLGSNELNAKEYLGEASTPKKLSLVGRWYFPTNVVRRLIKARMLRRKNLDSHDEFLLRISRCSLRRLFLGLSPTNQRMSTLAADAVFLKSNIRAFYFDRGVTLKCSNPLLELAIPAIKNEISVRSSIKDSGAIRVPRLIHVGVASDRCFFVEQLLDRARLFEPLRDGKKLARDLFDFYLRNGMVQRSVAEAVPLPKILNVVQRLFSQIGLDDASLRRFVNRNFVERDITKLGVPFGLTHGDMSVGNLLIEEGLTYIVDWERARSAPILTDFCKLFRQIPGLQPQFTALLHGWGQSQPLNAFNEKDDAAFGMLVQLAYLSQRSEDALGKSDENVTRLKYTKTLTRHARLFAQDLDSLGE